MHGDVVGLADVNGELVNNYSYDTFGNEKSNTENANPFRYAGEYFDEESGLIYLRNRYYDSSTGRFITEDPIHSGINWYVYAGNNPVNFVDPLGLSDIPDSLDWDDDGRVDSKRGRQRFYKK